MRVGRIVVAGVDGHLVGFGHGGVLLGEFAVEVLACVVLGTVVDIEADAQCEHVLALDDRLVVEARRSQGLLGHGRDVGYDDVVLFESQLGDGIERRESGFADVLLGERVAVDDDRGSLLEPFAVGFECRRVHGYQHIAIVARVELAVVAEVNLESGNARYGSLRGADFGGIVGECGDSVAEQCRGVGKKRTRKLHAVARVARKANHDVLQLLYIGFVHAFKLCYDLVFQKRRTNVGIYYRIPSFFMKILTDRNFFPFFRAFRAVRPMPETA